MNDNVSVWLCIEGRVFPQALVVVACAVVNVFLGLSRVEHPMATMRCGTVGRGL